MSAQRGACVCQCEAVCVAVCGGVRQCAVVRGVIGPLTWAVSAQHGACVCQCEAVCAAVCGGVRQCAVVCSGLWQCGGAQRCRATHIGCVGSAWCLCMSV